MNRRQKLVQKQFLNNEEAVIKRLDQVYKKSQEDINDKIKNLTFNIDKLQQQYSWMDDTDPEKEKVKSMIQSKIYQKQYQQQLQDQLDSVLYTMKVAQFNNVSEYLGVCYSDAFIGTIFDAHGQGVPFTTPINQEAMVRAVQLDSKISKGLYTRLGEDVDLLKKKIAFQVSRSIATGETFARTAKHLENYSRIGYNNAIRIIRTEGHRIQTTATMDAMTAAKDRGADIVKQWDSTLDGKTRSSHVAVDGEIRELDKKFSNGLDFPGDPHGKAAEVINCRCALLQRARWALVEKRNQKTGEVEYSEEAFSKFNNFSDQLESFNGTEDYGEFKKAFFSKENKQYMNYVEKLEERYGTKNFEKLLASMTDSEYNHYSKLLAKNPLYNVYEPNKNGVVAQTKQPNTVDMDSLRQELKTMKNDIAQLRSDYYQAKRSLMYYTPDKNAINAKIADLQQKIDDLQNQIDTKGKTLVENLNTTFKAPTDNKRFVNLVVDLDSDIEYKEVLKLSSNRTFDEIINALAGGDNTSGSCASVGLGYIGQKNGWDVLDFRGGESMDWFSSKINKINMWDVLNIQNIVEDSGKSNLTNGKRILKKMEKGKEYYLSVGRHASIVRKNDDGVIQYLELQSAHKSGWTDFNKDIGETLRWRFGCTPSSNYVSTAYLTDVADLENNDEFRTILGYINTNKLAQRKGSSGTIK